VLSELVLVYWLQDLCSSLIERPILAPVPVHIIHMYAIVLPQSASNRYLANLGIG
jgi:hypothetical protein